MIGNYWVLWKYLLKGTVRAGRRDPKMYEVTVAQPRMGHEILTLERQQYLKQVGEKLANKINKTQGSTCS